MVTRESKRDAAKDQQGYRGPI